MPATIVIDPAFDSGVAVERNTEGGTLHLDINTGAGRARMRLFIHPTIAEALRDRLVELYPHTQKRKGKKCISR